MGQLKSLAKIFAALALVTLSIMSLSAQATPISALATGTGLGTVQVDVILENRNDTPVPLNMMFTITPASGSNFYLADGAGEFSYQGNGTEIIGKAETKKYDDAFDLFSTSALPKGTLNIQVKASYGQSAKLQDVGSISLLADDINNGFSGANKGLLQSSPSMSCSYDASGIHKIGVIIRPVIRINCSSFSQQATA